MSEKLTPQLFKKRAGFEVIEPKIKTYTFAVNQSGHPAITCYQTSTGKWRVKSGGVMGKDDGLFTYPETTDGDYSNYEFDSMEEAYECFCGFYKNDSERCNHNRKKLSYLEWHDWAESKTKSGETQRQCPKCKLWLFEEEF